MYIYVPAKNPSPVASDFFNKYTLYLIIIIIIIIITSMALKSSEARAQKRNKTKSVIIFKSRGHTGVIISFKGPATI